MSTPQTIKQQLQADIAQANQATGRSDLNIHDAITQLINGYGGEGGSTPFESQTFKLTTRSNKLTLPVKREYNNLVILPDAPNSAAPDGQNNTFGTWVLDTAGIADNQGYTATFVEVNGSINSDGYQTNTITYSYLLNRGNPPYCYTRRLRTPTTTESTNHYTCVFSANQIKLQLGTSTAATQNCFAPSVPYRWIAWSSTEEPIEPLKRITPTKSEIDVLPDTGYVALQEVIVDPIPSNYIDTTDANAAQGDIVSGKSAYVNGSKITGNLVIQKYYTGSTDPASSLGNNGDLYLKV